MKTLKKVLKWIGIVLGALILLLIALHIVLNIVFGIQLRNTIRDLKAQGKPMTIAEITPAPVPDNENAAKLYQKAFMLMTSGEGGKIYIPGQDSGKMNKTIQRIEALKSFTDMTSWTDEQKAEIPGLVIPFFNKPPKNLSATSIMTTTKALECSYRILA